MQIQLGFIDNDGHPRLRIRVRGTNPNQFTDEEALVDTGFTGFLMLPVAKALPRGSCAVGDGTLQDDWMKSTAATLQQTPPAVDP